MRVNFLRSKDNAPRDSDIGEAMEPERSLTTAGSALRVGVLLAGVGGVGRAFVRVLQELFCTVEVQVRVVAVGDSKGFVAAPEQHHGFAWNDVAAILDHKKRGHAVASWRSTAPLSTGLVFDELVGALQHFHAQRDLDDYVVVDCTSSTAIAPALITARELGFAVVMANKLPVAGPFEQYKQLIHGAKGRVRYEATVGAGLPVVSVIQRIMASRDSVTLIQGGLSGTLTCVLSEMNRGASFSAALTQAHELGITENDPREDLSGADVVRKMVILAREIGLAVETSDVEIAPLLPQEAFHVPADEFMRSLHAYDEEFNARLLAANSEGCALAYIGTVHADGRIGVGLEHVPPCGHFATASSTEGVVSISSEWFPEPLLLRGTGAGAASTAAAVAGDLAAILTRTHP